MTEAQTFVGLIVVVVSAAILIGMQLERRREQLRPRSRPVTEPHEKTALAARPHPSSAPEYVRYPHIAIQDGVLYTEEESDSGVRIVRRERVDSERLIYDSQKVVIDKRAQQMLDELNQKRTDAEQNGVEVALEDL